MAAMSGAVLSKGTVFTAGFDGVAVEMKGYLTMSEFNASSLPYQTCAANEDTLVQPSRPCTQTLVQPASAPVAMVSTGKPTEALIAASPKPTVPGHVVMPPSVARKALVQPAAPVSMVSPGKPTEALIAASPKPTVPGHVVMPPSAAHKALVQPTQAPVSMVSTGKPTEALIAASPKPAVPGHVVMPPSAAPWLWCSRRRLPCQWCRRASRQRR